MAVELGTQLPFDEIKYSLRPGKVKTTSYVKINFGITVINL